MLKKLIFVAALAAWGCAGVTLPPCPAGTVGVQPFCQPMPTPPPADKCPAGTHGTPPSCVADAPPNTPPPNTPPPAVDLGTDNPEPANLVGGKTAEEGATPYADFAADVNKAIDVACGRCEAGFEVPDWVAYVKAVRDTMRSSYGYGARYDWQHGDADPARRDLPPGTWGLGSELSVWRNGHLESYQVVTSQRKVRRAPGAFRSRASIAGLCPLQLPLTGYSVALRVGPHGTTGLQWDGTPYVKDEGGEFPPRNWTGACRAHQCDLSPEKDVLHGESCTVDLCGPALDYRVEPEGSALVNWVDGYTAKVTPVGHGVIVANCPVGGAETRVTF